MTVSKNKIVVMPERCPADDTTRHHKCKRKIRSLNSRAHFNSEKLASVYKEEHETHLQEMQRVTMAKQRTVCVRSKRMYCIFAKDFSVT